MVRARRLPGSLLFAGRAGVGKLQAAIAVAQALNCRESDEDACGVCASCTRIERGEHGDVVVLRPEGKGGQLRAEAVRSAIADVPFRPFEGRHRVIILVDAERMNPTTANTILKTLEEPPPWATLILVTSNEATLLPTILSRCQAFRFSPLAPEELATLLVERHGISKERAPLLAAVSRGGLARALELDSEPLDELRAEALKVARVAAEGERDRELVPWADALSKETRLVLLLDLLLSIFRDAAARLAGAPVLHADLEREIGALAARAPLPVWTSSYALAEEALVDLRDRYLNKRITLSRLLADLRDLS
jgi:DNA polymerase-3 subunit delta'